METIALGIVQNIKDLDTQMLLGINQMHSAYWDSFMWLVTDKYVWIPLYISLIYVIFRNHSPKAFLWCAVAIGLMILITDNFNSQWLRPWIGRLRPSNLDNPISSMVHVVNDYRGGPYGFPSSHSSNTWGIVFFVAFLFRKYWLNSFLAAWAILVCYSRSYLGVHYPGDLFVGMLLGLTGAILAYLLFAYVTGEKPKKEIKHGYLPVIVVSVTFAGIIIISFFYHF